MDRILSCVAGSDHRWTVLSTLADEELDLRDLSDELGVPRTTLRHNVDRLLEHDLVEEALNRTYRLTPVGHATLVGLDAFRERVETATRLEPLFECVCPSELGFDVTALSDAEVTVARATRPFEPSFRMAEVLRDAASVVGIMSSLPPLTDDDFQELFSGESPSIELVVNDGLLEDVEREPTCELSDLAGRKISTWSSSKLPSRSASCPSTIVSSCRPSTRTIDPTSSSNRRTGSVGTGHWMYTNSTGNLVGRSADSNNANVDTHQPGDRKRLSPGNVTVHKHMIVSERSIGRAPPGCIQVTVARVSR